MSATRAVIDFVQGALLGDFPDEAAAHPVAAVSDCANPKKHRT